MSSAINWSDYSYVSTKFCGTVFDIWPSNQISTCLVIVTVDKTRICFYLIAFAFSYPNFISSLLSPLDPLSPSLSPTPPSLALFSLCLSICACLSVFCLSVHPPVSLCLSQSLSVSCLSLSLCLCLSGALFIFSHSWSFHCCVLTYKNTWMNYHVCYNNRWFPCLKITWQWTRKQPL